MVTVFLDASTVLDFSEPRCPGIFFCLDEFFSLNGKNSIFAVTDYILEAEIQDMPFLKWFRDLVKVHSVPPEELYGTSPPRNLDLGEWSIFLAINFLVQEGNHCCALASDGAARRFFEQKGVLPCRHFSGPHSEVGGTVGILKHLVSRKVITPTEKTHILQKMKQFGRRLP